MNKFTEILYLYKFLLSQSPSYSFRMSLGQDSKSSFSSSSYMPTPHSLFSYLQSEREECRSAKCVINTAKQRGSKLQLQNLQLVSKASLSSKSYFIIFFSECHFSSAYYISYTRFHIKSTFTPTFLQTGRCCAGGCFTTNSMYLQD